MRQYETSLAKLNEIENDLQLNGISYVRRELYENKSTPIYNTSNNNFTYVVHVGSQLEWHMYGSEPVIVTALRSDFI